MWESAEAIDQADAYAKKLLTSALPRLTALEKFNMLRSVSITSAGMRAYGEGTMSKEQLEAKVLKHYLEVIVLDVARHQKGLAENLTVDMMSQRSLKLKRITKRIQQALDTKSKKAKLKNEVPPEEGLYSGIEGNDLYAAIRAESNNTFNPIWVKALNKNGDMPSGVQLEDILDTVRKEVFNIKDIARRNFLTISRKKAAAKKAALPCSKTNKAEEEKGDENDDEHSEHQQEEEIAVKCILCCSLFHFS